LHLSIQMFPICCVPPYIDLYKISRIFRLERTFLCCQIRIRALQYLANISRCSCVVAFPTLFNLYSAYQPTHPESHIAEYADNKVIYSTHAYPGAASTNLQTHFNTLSLWYSHWRVKVNENISVRRTFALRHGQPPPVYLNNEPIPKSDIVKYLGLTFDKRLTWAKHIHLIQLKLNKRLYLLRPIPGKYSKISLKTKIHIYDLLLKPI